MVICFVIYFLYFGINNSFFYVWVFLSGSLVANKPLKSEAVFHFLYFETPSTLWCHLDRISYSDVPHLRKEVWLHLDMNLN